MSAQGVIFTLGEKNSSLKVTWETCYKKLRRWEENIQYLNTYT